MADLIKEYFKRDLSDLELDKLEALLEDEGKALQLLRAAKKRYEATGLPDPFQQTSLWQRWGFTPTRAWTAALATLLLAVLLPVALRQPPVALAPQRASNAPMQPRAKRLAKKASVRVKPQLMGAQAKDEMAGGAAAATLELRPRAMAARAERVAAPAAALSVKLLHAGPSWSFAVFLPKPSHILARILDARSQVRRVLLDRNSGQAKLVLAWDGKDVQGQALAPGAYSLEVISPDSKADLKIQLP